MWEDSSVSVDAKAITPALWGSGYPARSHGFVVFNAIKKPLWFTSRVLNIKSSRNKRGQMVQG